MKEYFLNFKFSEATVGYNFSQDADLLLKNIQSNPSIYDAFFSMR